MKKTFDDLAEIFSQCDCEKFENVFTDFKRTAKIEADEKQRILSSVMKKAGFEMKEAMTVKKTRRHGKRFVGFVIAAAVLAAGAMGAYAYNSFFNTRSVEQFMENPDKLEKDGFVLNQVIENDYMQITVDTVISDGYNAYVIYTTRSLTEDIDGRDIGNFLIGTRMMYAGNDESYQPRSSGTAYFDNDSENTSREFMLYDLNGIDTTRELKLMFYAFDFNKYDGMSCKVDKYLIPEDNPFGYDMYTTLSFAKNCDIETLTSADGKQIRLSQFELICDDVTLYSLAFDNEDIKLIKNDGSYDIPDKDRSYISYDEYEMTDCAIFGKFIDPDDYKGVEINGVEYLKQ